MIQSIWGQGNWASSSEKFGLSNRWRHMPHLGLCNFPCGLCFLCLDVKHGAIGLCHLSDLWRANQAHCVVTSPYPSSPARSRITKPSSPWFPYRASAGTPRSIAACTGSRIFVDSTAIPPSDQNHSTTRNRCLGRDWLEAIYPSLVHLALVTRVCFKKCKNLCVPNTQCFVAAKQGIHSLWEACSSAGRFQYAQSHAHPAQRIQQQLRAICWPPWTMQTLSTPLTVTLASPLPMPICSRRSLD